MIQANRILELSSGYGYSAICFAKGTSNNAEIICTDTSEENKNKALTYFKRKRIISIKFIVGEALDIINRLNGEFDIIFNNIDKENYPEVFKKAVLLL